MPQDLSADWMHSLAKHCQIMSAKYSAPLAIVFDIDGTIIDTRHTQLHILKLYDQVHNTPWFADISVEHITHYENHIEQQLSAWQLPAKIIEPVVAFYHRQRWQDEVLLESEKAYPNVLELIQWLCSDEQLVVALNTGRCDSLRRSTLQSLNQLAGTDNVLFDNTLLKMNRYGWQDVFSAKARALDELQQQGYKVIAMLDNEPANLNHLSTLDDDVLLLHADTIYGSNEPLHPRCISGSYYDLEIFKQSYCPADALIT